MTIQIDCCPECRGIWLEKGRPGKFTEKSNTLPVTPMAEMQRHKMAMMTTVSVDSFNNSLIDHNTLINRVS